jgi:hypothetical protein
LNWLGVTGIGGTAALAVGADRTGGMYTRYDGTSWSTPVYIGSFAPTPTAAGFQLSDVAFTGSAVVAVGLGGVVTRSTDGGFNWSPPTSVAPFDLLGVEFLDALTGLAVGAGGNVIRTLDGGVTWSSPVHAANVNLFALAMVDQPATPATEPASYLLTAIGMVLLIARQWMRRCQPAV